MQKKVKDEASKVFSIKVVLEEVLVRNGHVYVRISVNGREKWIDYATANNEDKELKK